MEMLHCLKFLLGSAIFSDRENLEFSDLAVVVIFCTDISVSVRLWWHFFLSPNKRMWCICRILHNVDGPPTHKGGHPYDRNEVTALFSVSINELQTSQFVFYSVICFF